MNDLRDGKDPLGADDPLALFRGMGTPHVGPGDIAAMKSRVSDLRRARSLAQDPSYAWAFGESEKRPRPLAGWRGAALLGLILLPAAVLQGPGVSSKLGTAGLAVASVPSALPLAIHPQAAALPLVEDFDSRTGEVLQIEDGDLSVVVVH